MKIIHLPENGTQFVEYEIDGNTIDFNDGELTIKLSKKERDEDCMLDIVEDATGGLICSTAGGRKYVAQIFIPARQYEITGEGEEATRKAVPFDVDRCVLTLWEMEA